MVRYYEKKKPPLFVTDGILDNGKKLIEKNKTSKFSKIYRGSCGQILDNSLTKTQKSYIMLYYNENKTQKEIAEIYGVNKSTVSRTISRAKKNILDAFPAYAS